MLKFGFTDQIIFADPVTKIWRTKNIDQITIYMILVRDFSETDFRGCHDSIELLAW